MSIVKTYSVFCDVNGPRCQGWVVETTDGAVEARREARQLDWLRVNGQDVCPSCRAGGGSGEPTTDDLLREKAEIHGTSPSTATGSGEPEGETRTCRHGKPFAEHCNVCQLQGFCGCPECAGADG